MSAIHVRFVPLRGGYSLRCDCGVASISHSPLPVPMASMFLTIHKDHTPKPRTERMGVPLEDWIAEQSAPKVAR